MALVVHTASTFRTILCSQCHNLEYVDTNIGGMSINLGTDKYVARVRGATLLGDWSYHV